MCNEIQNFGGLPQLIFQGEISLYGAFQHDDNISLKKEELVQVHQTPLNTS